MGSHGTSLDERIANLIESARQLTEGRYSLATRPLRSDALGQLEAIVMQLAHRLEQRDREIQELDRLTTLINTGLLIDEILESAYERFRQFIPYNRIGLSLIEDEGKSVRALWARSDQPIVRITKGYMCDLAGSTLERIAAHGAPRIINDLTEYLRSKPSSQSTRLIVEEGMRSSLTCPLIVRGVPVGFLFFSSTQPNVYAHAHVETYMRIAHRLSVIIDKGRVVSELTEQRAAIEAQNQELRRLDDLKNSFLGMAAHDLRNPTSLIATMASMLLDPNLDLSAAERLQLVQSVNDSAEYMLKILNDLLDVSHIESGKLTLSKSAFRLDAFLAEVALQHRKPAEHKGTRICVDRIPEGQVLADPLRLRQVLDNLISNAIKFSPRGSVVAIDAKPLADGWRVQVRDQGPGITPQDRSRLFQDFARLTARPTGGENSTGLGLAIARRVIEAHGGRIDVDSEPGQGATFWFVLPHAAERHECCGDFAI